MIHCNFRNKSSRHPFNGRRILQLIHGNAQAEAGAKRGAGCRRRPEKRANRLLGPMDAAPAFPDK
jgi:hypothetical protein